MTRSARTVLIGALALGALLRLVEVGSALLFGDELHSLRDMHGGYLQLLRTFSDTGAGMLLPLLQRVLIDAFGASHWTIRAPAWLAGLGLLLVSYPIARRHVSEGVAVGVTALVAISPILVFYAHFARIYALIALLCLLLLAWIEALLARAQQVSPAPVSSDPVWSVRDWGVLVGVTALLPYAHPTALGFVLPVFAAAIATALWSLSRPRLALRFATALAIAGLLCLAAHAPASASLEAFVNNKTTTPYPGSFGVLDVATLLFGGRALAWAALALGLAAAGGLVVQRGARALPLLAACAGPGIVIALVAPYGDAYAYARYALPSLVPCLLLLGRGVDALLARFADAAAPRISTLSSAASAGLALALYLTGPLGPGALVRAQHAQHGNTYLALRPLPAFDAPWPDAPAFYRTLAERVGVAPGTRVIEAPALTTRTRHLYRAYQRQHGATTVLAPFPREFPRIPSGPYVSLEAQDWIETSRADYLILHLDVGREVLRYWDFVYGTPEAARDADRAYMERHRQFGGPLAPVPPRMLSGLVQQLGEPSYRDQDIVVWTLGPESD